MSSHKLRQYYLGKGWEILDRVKGRSGKRFLIASSRGTTSEREERYFFAGDMDQPDTEDVVLAFSISASALACAHVRKLVGDDHEAFILQAGLLRMKEALLEDETPRKVKIDLHSESPATEFRIPSTAQLRAEGERAKREILEFLAEREYRGNNHEATRDEVLDAICVSETVFNRVHDVLWKRGWIRVPDKDGGILITPDGEDELDRLQQRTPSVAISSLYADTVEIIKQDGTRHTNQKASVQRELIIMDHSTFAVDGGDLVVRRMSNGREETYRVLDPGFKEKFHAIKAHYEMQVQNLGVPEAKQAVATITHNTYNLNGPNARVNQNSTDISTNIVNTDARAIQYVESLRNEIRSMSLTDDERTEALATLDEVESQVQSPSPSKRIINSLLKQLPNAETITNIVATLVGLFK